MRRREKKRMVNAGILAAVLAGAATYYLYGTESGERARKQIRKKAEDVKDKAVELKERAMETGDELVDAGKEAYEDMATFLRAKRNLIKNLDKDDIDDLAERIRERWEDTKEDIQDMIEEAEED